MQRCLALTKFINRGRPRFFGGDSVFGVVHGGDGIEPAGPVSRVDSEKDPYQNGKNHGESHIEWREADRQPGQSRNDQRCAKSERYAQDAPDSSQASGFYKKLQVRQHYIDDKSARENARTSPERPIIELGLGTRATEALAKANITKVGQVIELLEKGEAGILGVDGFGRKSLADLKKRLRQFGYELPEAAQEIVV